MRDLPLPNPSDSSSAVDDTALIEDIVSDQKKFEAFVYTPLADALDELSARHNDLHLAEKVRLFFPYGVLEPLRERPKLVLGRQVATPNYEFRRFMSIADAVNMEPLVWEYYDDKLTFNNTIKYHLGKVCFFNGTGKKGGVKIHREAVIDFIANDGKKIRDVKTLWGQSLIDFHHELLKQAYPHPNRYTYDASAWLHAYGDHARDYYRPLIASFVQHGILFENFVLQGSELEFTKTVFLPHFLAVMRAAGKRPLIVALEPTNLESEEFWLCQTQDMVEHVKALRLGRRITQQRL